MNSNVRKITDGAMMCAIVGVFLVADRWLGGVFSGTLLFLFPLPMVFYATRYGKKDSWMVLAAMSLLGFIISGPQMLFYVASESLLGLIYGSGIHEGKPTERLVISAMLIGILVNLVSTVILAAFFGYDLTADITYLQEFLDKSAAQSGMILPDTLTNMETLKTMLVVGAVMTGILEGYVTHMLSRLMMKRLRFRVEPLKPLALYFPPKWTGYLGIACLMAYEYAILKPFDNPIVQNTAIGFGVFGVMYLVAFGAVFLIFLLRTRLFRGRGALLTALIAFLMMFTMSLPMAIGGFLYITTDLHQRLLDSVSQNGGANHA